jgi:K(+)-stimulated pyrophosphate-energized sodium pump
VALFAQLGGGIYTKAADVGSDLVGKVEAGIPEDDPRNAGVIADLVGDNVGDCAGRGADLFESTAAENIGAMILGVAAFVIAQGAGWPNPEAWIFFPLVVRAFGLLATIVAMYFVRGREDEDPMNILNRGYWATTILSVVGLGVTDLRDDADRHRAGRRDGHPDVGLDVLRRHRRPGHERRLRLHHPVLHGRLLAAGEGDRRGVAHRPGDEHHLGRRGRLRDDLRDRLTIGVALLASAFLGLQAFAGTTIPAGAIFGTAVATMGMLMTTAYILAMDTFGPITDNAGGIAEFSRSEAGAREITDRLDAVGNTTKALTKGYAIASASLAAFLLFSAYIDKVNLILEHSGRPLMDAVNLANVPSSWPPSWARCWPSSSAALAIRAVGKAAQAIIVEVRRQFREMPGIMDYSQRPDYARVVDITTAGRAARDGPARRGRGGHPDRRRRAARPRGGRRPADGRHHLGRAAGDRPQQRRRRVGQRQEVHRVGPPARRDRQRRWARDARPTPRPSSATPSATRSRTPPARRCTCWSSCWRRSRSSSRRCSSAEPHARRRQ